MRIGIDISFVTNSRAGIEQYLYNLLRCLAKIDRHNSYFLYSNKDVPEEFAGLGDNFSVRIRRNRFLPRVVFRYDLDVREATVGKISTSLAMVSKTLPSSKK